MIPSLFTNPQSVHGSPHEMNLSPEAPHLDAINRALEEAVSDLDQARKRFLGSGPAEMAIRLIGQIENEEGRKIHEITEELKRKLGTTNLLLQLQSYFTSLPDLSSQEPSSEMKKILVELKNQGIEIWDENTPIPKDKIFEIKAQINAQIERLRTEHQTVMTTDLQYKTNSIQAFLNIARQIVAGYERLMENISKRIYS